MKKKSIKKLIPKAGLALKNGFYLEASWILSAIIEVKLRKVLFLITNENQGLSVGLHRCLLRIKSLQLKGLHPLLGKNMEIRLIDDLRIWKNKRNSIYQDMTVIHVRQARIRRMVEEGIVLHQELNNAFKNLKKACKQVLVKESALPAVPNEKTPRK